MGFIADLPTELVAAFRATLEEVLEADVIVHVRDAAHDESDAQKADVLKVLDELGVPEDRADDGSAEQDRSVAGRMRAPACWTAMPGASARWRFRP